MNKVSGVVQFTRAVHGPLGSYKNKFSTEDGFLIEIRDGVVLIGKGQEAIGYPVSLLDRVKYIIPEEAAEADFEATVAEEPKTPTEDNDRPKKSRRRAAKKKATPGTA